MSLNENLGRQYTNFLKSVHRNKNKYITYKINRYLQNMHYMNFIQYFFNLIEYQNIVLTSQTDQY